MKQQLMSKILIPLILLALIFQIPLAGNVAAQDAQAIQLFLDGSGEYSDDWTYSQQFYVNIPSSYQGDYIHFYARTMGNRWDNLELSFKTHPGGSEYVRPLLDISSAYAIIEVPVFPGEPIYLVVRVKEGGSSAYLYGAVKSVLSTSSSSSTGTVDVWVPSEDDDDLTVSLFIDGEIQTVKIVPALSSEGFGSYQVEVGTHDFEIFWTDPDTDQTYNIRNTFSVDAGSQITTNLLISRHVPSYPTASLSPEPTSPSMVDVNVYIRNLDDDALDVQLYIDDVYQETDTVDVLFYHVPRFGAYSLLEGSHQFRVRWRDPDTGDEWYEVSSTEDIELPLAGSASVTFELVAHDVPEDLSATAVVNIKNKDDDTLEVTLYVDGDFKTRKTLDHWQQHVESISLAPGEHAFRIFWSEPDTGNNYTKESTIDIAADETRKVNLEIPEPEVSESEVRVTVYNVDDDQLDITLWIDGDAVGTRSARGRSFGSGKADFGSFKLTTGSHTFEISWWDDDTNREHRVEKTQSVGDEASTVVLETQANAGAPGGTVDVRAEDDDDASDSGASSMEDRIINPNFDLSDPQGLFGMNIAGLTESAADSYEGDLIKSMFLGVGGYASPASSWEEVARFEFLSGKNSLNQANNLGYIEGLDTILDTVYALISFKEAVSDAPGQFKTLRGLGSLSELTKNANTLNQFVGNLATIYDTAYKADQVTSQRAGIPQADAKVMMIIGAVASGGWSLLGDLSNAILSDDFTAQSINYKIQKGTLGYMLAHHAQEMHAISLQDSVTETDLKAYFEHAERFLVLKRLERLLDYRDQVYTWKTNPDFTIRTFSFFGVIDTSSELDQAERDLEEFLKLYDMARENLNAKAQNLGVRTFE